MPNIASLLSKNLKHYRELKGLSQKDVAQAIGVHRNTVSSYESGEVGSITIDVLAKLAALFKVEESDLVYSGEPQGALVRKPTIDEVTDIISYALRLMAAEGDGLKAETEIDSKKTELPNFPWLRNK